MNKIKKILLWVFIAMFAIPEILWSPVGNFVYESSQNTNHVQPLRSNFLTQTDNLGMWGNFLLFQFFGLFFIVLWLMVAKKTFKHQFLFWILIVTVFVLAMVVLNAYGDSRMRISF